MQHVLYPQQLQKVALEAQQLLIQLNVVRRDWCLTEVCSKLPWNVKCICKITVNQRLGINNELHNYLAITLYTCRVQYCGVLMNRSLSISNSSSEVESGLQQPGNLAPCTVRLLCNGISLIRCWYQINGTIPGTSDTGRIRRVTEAWSEANQGRPHGWSMICLLVLYRKLRVGCILS